MSDIEIIIISVAITSGMWGILIQLLGQGYFEKMNRDWKTKQESEIVNLRSSLKREEDISLNLLKLYKSSTDEIQKRRILCASELWDYCMEMKEITSPLNFYSSLTDSGISNPDNKTDLQDKIKKLPEYGVFYEQIQLMQKNSTKLRPFVNDESWKIFDVYMGFRDNV